MADGIANLTTATFDEALASSDNPVVVDFWATWCGPCKQVAPILEEIANEYGDQITIAKLDVDEHAEIARRFDVVSIPTIILFKDSQPEARIVGARGKRQLLEEFEPFMS